jgi:hypothetical protein
VYERRSIAADKALDTLSEDEYVEPEEEVIETPTTVDKEITEKREDLEE